MDSYLKNAKESAGHLDKYSAVYVVVGNESCDLDSAISTLVYSYYLSSKHTSEDIAVLPVLNISAIDLPLKTEVIYFLEQNKIPLECLIFRDELKLVACKQVFFILVDHNSLSLGERGFVDVSSVIEVIDHRPQEWTSHENCEITIELVGSCATLVTEKMMRGRPDLVDETVARLLHGTIILDTVCLSEVAKRVTPKDVEMIQLLEGILGGISREEAFQGLKKAKEDVSQLSTFQLLKKDVKVVSNSSITIGIASVPLLIQDFLKRRDVSNVLPILCQRKLYHILVLMGIQVTDNGNNVTRELAVYSPVDTYREQIVEVLEANNEPPLMLDPLPSSVSSLSVFHQGNHTVSRKVVLPILKSFLVGDRTSLDGTRSPGDTGSGRGRASSFTSSGSAPSRDEIETSPTPVSPHSLDSPAQGQPRIPNGLAAGMVHQVAQYLGVGDPFSQGGSSQSSAQNSCPYTPQNSCADDGVIEDKYPLPSFNSRDMMEKIQSKRGKLMGYEVEDDVDRLNYPFTPANSFVESSTLEAAYGLRRQQVTPEFEPEVILAKLYEKKLRPRFGTCEEVDEAETEVVGALEMDVRDRTDSAGSREMNGQTVR